jgi:hypothetical protein
MEPTTRIQQLYGYTVCLVALIVFLINVGSIITAIFDRAHPLQSDRYRFGYAGVQLTSYEAYRASVRANQSSPGPDGRQVPVDTLTPEQWRAQYAALRRDAIETAIYDTNKRITVSVLLIVLATVLFGIHWAWLTRHTNLRATLRAREVSST